MWNKKKLGLLFTILRGKRFYRILRDYPNCYTFTKVTILVVKVSKNWLVLWDLTKSIKRMTPYWIGRTNYWFRHFIWLTWQYNIQGSKPTIKDGSKNSLSFLLLTPMLEVVEAGHTVLIIQVYLAKDLWVAHNHQHCENMLEDLLPLCQCK